MKKTALILALIAELIIPPSLAFAGPQSTSYEIKDYTFGAGGTGQGGITGASNYTIFGTAGEIDTGKLNGSSLYSIGNGLTYTLKANVPAAPTFTNPASNYDRLKIIIDTGGNPTDTTFAVAISTDNFASDTRYIQSDFTIGSGFDNTNFLDYTTWGGATGVYITGLASGTSYYVKVKARQGNFTESEYSAASNATTSDPILTFSLDSSSLNFSNLNAGNSYTDSAKTTILTTTTNAYNGYTVYGKESAALTSSVGTISDYASSNSSPTTWSGTGFGYTTSDNNLGGGTVDRFTNGGPKYAGFPISSSSTGDPVADHSGPVVNPTISNEAFTITYRVTGNNLTKAGTYTNTVIYTIVPTY